MKSSTLTTKYRKGKWSFSQHNRFMDALELHGKCWAIIQKKVKTRTVDQIRSHAQKVFQSMPKSDLDMLVKKPKTFPKSKFKPIKKRKLFSQEERHPQYENFEAKEEKTMKHEENGEEIDQKKEIEKSNTFFQKNSTLQEDQNIQVHQPMYFPWYMNPNFGQFWYFFSVENNFQNRENFYEKWEIKRQEDAINE